jgi:hypothetical protein
MLLDHAFEMQLKAGILHKGGRLRDPGERYLIGFERALGRALSDSKVKFLSEGEALTLQAVNALRDATQHHYVDICEEQLFLHVQNGVTVFGDILHRVFGFHVYDLMPRRVLPVSSVAFRNIDVLFSHQVEEVQKLLMPGRRKRQEAIAALRPLAILEGALTGSQDQPSERELSNLAKRIQAGTSWTDIFPAISSIECTEEASPAGIALRISKREGIATQIVPAGSEGAGALAIKRVDEQGFYSLTTTEMAKQLGITQPKFYALSQYLGMPNDPEYFKVLTLGKVEQKRYSLKALRLCHERCLEMTASEWDVIWQTHRPKRRNAP